MNTGKHQEIWFRIKKDRDGFPRTRDWEGLRCVKKGSGFQVESIPFYLNNVAFGDIVGAKVSGKGYWEFDSVIERSGYSVFRLLLRTDESPTMVVDELLRRGFLVERDDKLIALAVSPSSDLEAAVSYILAGKEQGRWGAQDGFVYEEHQRD